GGRIVLVDDQRAWLRASGEAHASDDRRVAQTMHGSEECRARAGGAAATGGFANRKPVAPTAIADGDAAEDAQRDTFHGLGLCLVPIGALVLAAEGVGEAGWFRTPVGERDRQFMRLPGVAQIGEPHELSDRGVGTLVAQQRGDALFELCEL